MSALTNMHLCISNKLRLYFQFDNVKRVFKVVEEMTGSLVDNIKTYFLLSDHLAQLVLQLNIKQNLL